MTRESLSALNTGLISISGISLLVGWYFIRRRKDIARHRGAMLLASLFAGLFLVSYVARWSLFGSKPFEGAGAWRALYLGVLLPHIVLAIALGPLALYLIDLALRKRNYKTHKRWARRTLPIWLFVVASGWLIYLLLYQVSF